MFGTENKGEGILDDVLFLGDDQELIDSMVGDTKKVENEGGSVAATALADELAEVIDHKETVEPVKSETETKNDVLPQVQFVLNSVVESFKEAGIEISLDENDSPQLLAEKLTKSIVSKEVENPESELFQTVKKHIFDENGIDDRVLAMATGIPFGVPRDEYIALYDIQDFASSEIEMTDQNALKALFATYHSIKNISEEDMEDYVAADLQNATPDLIEKRKSALLSHVDSEFKRINKLVSDRREIQRTEESKRNELVNSFVKKGEVAGHRFSKEQFDSFFSAISDKSEEIELPDGSRRKVTLLAKKRYEFQQKNYEKALLDDMLFFFDGENKGFAKTKEVESKKTAGSFAKLLGEDFKNYGVDSKEVSAKKDSDPDSISFDAEEFEVLYK
jgi:hypothetical protein